MPPGNRFELLSATSWPRARSSFDMQSLHSHSQRGTVHDAPSSSAEECDRASRVSSGSVTGPQNMRMLQVSDLNPPCRSPSPPRNLKAASTFQMNTPSPRGSWSAGSRPWGDRGRQSSDEGVESASASTNACASATFGLEGDIEGLAELRSSLHDFPEIMQETSSNASDMGSDTSERSSSLGSGRRSEACELQERRIRKASVKNQSRARAQGCHDDNDAGYLHDESRKRYGMADDSRRISLRETYDSDSSSTYDSAGGEGEDHDNTKTSNRKGTSGQAMVDEVTRKAKKGSGWLKNAFGKLRGGTHPKGGEDAGNQHGLANGNTPPGQGYSPSESSLEPSPIHHTMGDIDNEGRRWGPGTDGQLRPSGQSPRTAFCTQLRDKVNHGGEDERASEALPFVKVHVQRKLNKELANLRQTQVIHAHNGAIHTVKFSADGKFLASAGQDKVVRVWEVVLKAPPLPSMIGGEGLDGDVRDTLQGKSRHEHDRPMKGEQVSSADATSASRDVSREGSPFHPIFPFESVQRSANTVATENNDNCRESDQATLVMGEAISRNDGEGMDSKARQDSTGGHGVVFKTLRRGRERHLADRDRASEETRPIGEAMEEDIATEGLGAINGGGRGEDREGAEGAEVYSVSARNQVSPVTSGQIRPVPYIQTSSQGEMKMEKKKTWKDGMAVLPFGRNVVAALRAPTSDACAPTSNGRTSDERALTSDPRAPTSDLHPPTSDIAASDIFAVNGGQLEPENTVGVDGESIQNRDMEGKEADHVIPPLFALKEEAMRSLRGHEGEILAISWSKSHSYLFLISASTDKTVRLWHVSVDMCLRVFHHSDSVTSVDFSPCDDSLFVSGSLDKKGRLWSVGEHKVEDWVDMQEWVTAIAFASDGKKVLIGTHKGSCRIYDVIDKKLKLETTLDVAAASGKNTAAARVTGLQTMLADPTKVLVTSNDSRIRLFDGDSLKTKFKGHKSLAGRVSASFTPSGSHVICASEDSHIYVWNIEEAPHVPYTFRKGRPQQYECFPSCNAAVAIFWPGFSVPPSSFSTSPLENSSSALLQNGSHDTDSGCLPIAKFGGLGFVIVTAGILGEIGTFQDFPTQSVKLKGKARKVESLGGGATR
eukprot:TRINITY_DN757_c0_g1_i1.p1 TRINITY_DN757_c0_g1~~TRINITY_DN757_c0_g1_i1.p1  ORF type:complete len:1112 (+),score=177.21 TRINITY_DN757_c0_g1_i1:2425-5760(+)